MRRLTSSRELRFVIVGGWNTIFGLLMFTLLHVTVDRIGYVMTLLIAQALAVLQSHAAQRWLVWRSAGPYLPELLRFAAVYVVATIVNVILLAALVEGLEAPVLASQYVVGGALVVATYLAQRHWTFASRHLSSAPNAPRVEQRDGADAATDSRQGPS